MKLNASNVNIPVWKEITVKSNLPKELEKLEELARNIWWAWNYEAREMFQSLTSAFGKRFPTIRYCCWKG